MVGGGEIVVMERVLTSFAMGMERMMAMVRGSVLVHLAVRLEHKNGLGGDRRLLVLDLLHHDQLVGDADLDEPVYEELGRRDQSMLASAGPGARLVVQVEAHRFGPAVGVGPLELLEVLALGALSDLTSVDLAERQVQMALQPLAKLLRDNLARGRGLFANPEVHLGKPLPVCPGLHR